MSVEGTPVGHELLPELAALPGHLCWRAAARVTAAMNEVLPAGVDHVAYAALLALAGGATRSQQSVAEAVSISRTTMVRVAADLADAGLVERVRNPADRRSYALTRTSAGAAAARRWRRHVDAAEDQITGGLSPAERAELRDLLLDAIHADLAPDTPDALRGSVAFLLTRVHARMHRTFTTLLAPLGIEPRHFGSLVTLDATGAISQGELARHLGVSAASTVQIVDELEERGLVERRRPASDRRTQVLHLRTGAPEVLGRAVELSVVLADDELAALSAVRRSRVVALLHQLVTAA